REIGSAEVARSRFHGDGEGVAKLGLALGIARAQLWIADREGPVLALEQHRLALLLELPGELPRCLHRHVALRRRRRKQRDPVAHRCIDALFKERHEKFGLAGEVPVERTLRVAGLGGDLIDPGLAVPPACEHTQRRRKQLIASLAAVCASGAGALIETALGIAMRPAPPPAPGRGRLAWGHAW